MVSPNAASPAVAASNHSGNHTGVPDGTSASPYSPISKEASAHSNRWLQDLELLHHWSTSTYLTFQMPKHNHDLWQIQVPRVAFQHAFLMHGLLAVTSLHLAHLHPNEKQRHYLISTSHQNSALAGFSTALQDVTRHNGEAVFLASIFVSLFAFGSSAIKCTDPEEPFGMCDVVELLVLIRGIEQTLSTKNTRKWVQEGRVASMLRAPSRTDPPVKQFEYVFRPYLDDFKDFVARSRLQYDANSIEAITHALAELDRTYELLLTEKPVINSGYIMSWPTCVSMDFLTLLQDGNPLALLLLAVFCALLHYHEDRWLWASWGARVIVLVRNALDPQWHSWLRWPKEVIDSGAKFNQQIHVDYTMGNGNKGWPSGSLSSEVSPSSA